MLDTVEAARAGNVVGTAFEGQRRFSLAVRPDDEAARTPDALGNVPVASPSGASVPLGQLPAIELDTGPAHISREAVRRRIVVETNVRGRDVASFVAEAKERLAIVVPLALGLIFAMLSVKPAALIYLNVPFAATGGVVALALRGLPFSISAGVGFIALFGGALLTI